MKGDKLQHSSSASEHVHADTSAPWRALCLWSPVTRKHISLLCVTVVPLPAVLPPFTYVLMQGLSTAMF